MTKGGCKTQSKWTKGHNPRPETLKMLEEKKEKELLDIDILSEKKFNSSGKNSNN